MKNKEFGDRFEFTELIDIEELRSLCESFTAITGSTTAILDLEGKILLSTGWQEICTRFHRVNKTTAGRCIESDNVLSQELAPGESYKICKCRNGLVDAAIPIMVSGKHVANFFTGQFFLEQPDQDYFIRQAEEFGFDKKEYLEALKRVPVFSESQVKTIMNFFSRLSRIIGEMGLTYKKLEYANSSLQKYHEQLGENYRTVIDNMQDVFYRSDVLGNLVMVSPSFLTLLGYDAVEKCIGKPIAETFYYNPEQRKEFLEQINNNGKVTNYEVILKKSDGTPVYVETSSHIYYDDNGNCEGIEGIIHDVTMHKKDEEKLREALIKRKELEFIINHSPVVVWLWKATEGWPVEYVSENISDFGYTTGDFTSGRIMYESIIHPDDLERVADEVRKNTEVGKPEFIQEYRILKKSGEVCWIEDRTWVRCGADGSVTHYQGIIIDINERKRVEEALRLNKKHLEAVVDGSPIPQFVIDKNHLIIHWNRALEEYSGIRSADVIGTNRQWMAFYDHQRPCLSDLLVDGEIDKISTLYESKYRKSTLVENAYEATDFFHAMKGGIWLHFTSAPIFDSNGNISGAIETLADITEQKRAEEAVRSSEKRYRNLYESMMDAFVYTDMDGNIVEFNEVYRKMLGYEPEELRSLTYIDITPDKWHAFEAEIIEKQAMHRGYTDLYEKEYRRKDGKVFPIELRAVLTRDENGKPKGLWGIVRDITDRKQIEESTRLNSERLDTLLKINQMTDVPVSEIMKYTFEEALRFTGSEIGYLGLVSEDETYMDVQVWSRNVMPECRIDDKTIQFQVGNAGLWGEAIRQRRSIVTNDYQSDNPLKKGYPDGHIAIKRHMNVPVFDGSKIVLLAGVGNKAEEYDETDVRQLTLLMEGMWRIIERNRTENELRESQRRLSDIISFLPDATIVVDKDDRVIAWNRAIEDMTGIKAEDMLGKDNYEYAIPFYGERRPILIDLLLHPEPDMEKKYTTIQKIGDIILGEAYTPCLPGGGRYLSATTSVLRDSTGQIIAAIECIRDNTEQKMSEAALRASEEKFRSIYQYTPDIMFFVKVEEDGSFLIDDINPAEEKWLGCKNEELRYGKQLKNYISEKTAEKIESRYRLCLAKKSTIQYVDSYEISGEMRTFEIMLLPLQNEKGHIHHIFWSGRDITERKKAEEERRKLEEQLIQAKKMESIGRLAGGVAHDFNNMLTPILGYAELLKHSMSHEDQRQLKLDEIIRASERSRDLVRQLLAFARKQTLEMNHVNLNNIITGFENMLRHTIHENINLEIRLTALQGSVIADIGQIEQIILNLVVNAQDAMPNGGDLFITTSMTELDETYAMNHEEVKAGSYNVIEVTDTGEGMDRETCKKIFEPFYSTKGGMGTGIGLATVYGIVKQHGGHISVYSEPGSGTTFKVYFPRYTEAAALFDPVQRCGLNAPLQGHETVIVVEDQEQVRIMTVNILKDNGYLVLEAGDVKNAVSVASSFKGYIHLLITDVMLPDGNGRELYDTLSAERSGLRILYMSGYPSNVIMHHGVLDPGVKFIQKPFTLTSLTKKVREVLDNK